MVRITCSRILKFYFSLTTTTTKSSSRCFNSRPLSHNLITKNISWNRSLSSSSSSSSSQSHAQMGNDHRSVTIDTFDALYEERKLTEAVEAVKILEEKGYPLDLPRLLRLAKLCGEAEALEEARVVHHHCITASSDVTSKNKMIKMFSNCGSNDDALKVFDEMPERNSETWCVIMSCLAKNGDGELAIDMFSRFKKEGNKPNKEIFKAVFSACASLCDIHEGLLHFEAMYRDYGIVPDMEDYVSVTEMLAASGYLDEALEFVERMKVEPSVEVWETLMNLCWIHGDLELGDRLAEVVKKLDDTRMNNAGLVVAGKASDYSEKEKLKEMMRWERDKEKRRASEFSAGDTSHPESDRIMDVLRSLKVHMLEMGFVPDIKLYWGVIEDEDKEEQLLFRGEKLACAYGILNSKPRSPLTLIRNLRICNDGHNTMKMISVITGRTLTIRDYKRFHYFRNGVCSCQDYW